MSVANETGDARRQVDVYRLYDSDDQLLYVGIANQPKVRFGQHRRDKAWWHEVATREVVWCASREAALREESRAIERELPRYNDVGVQWPHHLLGDAPAEPVTMSAFKADPGGVMDRVAATGQPIVVTRSRTPLVVLVPYFDRADVARRAQE